MLADSFEALADAFFIFFPNSRVHRITDSYDLFTPNEIPLLSCKTQEALPDDTMAFCRFLEKQGLDPAVNISFANDIFVLTKEYVKQFRPVFTAFMEAAPCARLDFAAAFARWAFAKALAIPAGKKHPLNAYE